MPKKSKSRSEAANAAAERIVATAEGKGFSDERIELVRTGAHLLALGYHIYPVGMKKLPVGKWRKGAKDYALDPATLRDLVKWIRTKDFHGWSVISSARTGHVTIDLEPEAFKDPVTKAAAEALRDSVPASCVVKSRHGGFHIYLQLDEGEEVPTDTHICKRDIGITPKPLPSGKKPDSRSLILELRRPPSYAVPVGPGRPRLSETFELYVITRAEYEALVAPFRQLHEESESEKKRKKTRRKYEKKAGTRRRLAAGGSKKGDTPEVVFQSLRDGELGLEDVLPEECIYLGDSGGQELFLREGSDAGSSGNMVGGVIVVWSTSLEWADPGVPMSPMMAIANHSFDGDMRKACDALEAVAKAFCLTGEIPTDGPFEGWPAEVLKTVHEKREKAKKDWMLKGGDLKRGQQKTIPVGQKFASAHLDGFKYVWGIGWHEWDGARWLHDEGTQGAVEGGASVWAVSEIIKLIEEEAPDAVVNGMLSYREDGRIVAMVKSSRKEDGFHSKASEMDTHTHLLNCPNGVVDLRTGEMRASDPGLLFTKVTKAEYHAGAIHPDWDMALEAAPGEVGEFLQIRLGQSLFGEPVPTDEVVFCRGDGENGKTAILGTVYLAVGDFAVLVPDSVLISKSREHPTDLMTMRGSRLAMIEELPEDHRLNMNRVKKIIGTEVITARMMKKDYVSFAPTHSLFVTTNYDPVITETDRGSLRRLVVVEFPLTFVKAEEDLIDRKVDRLGDPGLKQRLRRNKATKEAALAWAVEGAIKCAGGALPPLTSVVESSTENWLSTADVLGQWIEAHITFDTAEVESVQRLVEDFNIYTGRSVPDWSPKTFNTRFKSHRLLRGRGVGHKKARPYPDSKKTVMSWAGVKLNSVFGPGL